VFADCGFRLSDARFLNTRISRSWYDSMQRHFISPRHREGEPIGRGMKTLIGLPIFLNSLLDEMFVEKANLAQMIFLRA